MGYYDSVKDSVKNNESSSSGQGGGSFDTLKKNAEKETEKEEKDDTPIEVLDEGLEQKQPSTGSDKENSSSEFPPASSNDDNISSGDNSNLEEKLDKIIEQNARMIEILESFGN